jgi:hypothetical protein
MGVVFFRFILGVFLPMILGTAVFLIIGTITSSKESVGFSEILSIILMSLILFPFAMIFVGVQSLIYSFLMEFAVNPFVKSDLIAVLISLLLGVLSGFVLSDPEMMMIGAIVGLVVGIILRSIYTFEAHPDG